MIRKFTLFAALCMFAGGGAAKTEQAQYARPSWRSPAADLEHGAELAIVCATCHVENSPEVDPSAPRLTRQRQSYLFFAMRAYRDGDRENAIMAGMVAGLSDQDLRDLSAFLAGEMLDRPPRARVDMPAYEQTIAQCTLCHGETGIGEYENMPVLAGQDPAYLRNALESYRAGTRSNPTMRAIAAGLDAEDLAPLAEYYSAHEWLEHGQ